MQGKSGLMCLVWCSCLLGTLAHAETYRYKGRDLAANCFQCHGTNGNAVSGMPRLSGMPAETLLSLMTTHQNQDPSQQIMNVHAQGYNDAELALIAQYFAEQPQ